MRKYIFLTGIFLFAGISFVSSFTQVKNTENPPQANQSHTPFLTPEEKRAMRKGLVVKEMNTDASGKKSGSTTLPFGMKTGTKWKKSSMRCMASLKELPLSTITKPVNASVRMCITIKINCTGSENTNILTTEERKSSTTISQTGSFIPQKFSSIPTDSD